MEKLVTDTGLCFSFAGYTSAVSGKEEKKIGDRLETTALCWKSVRVRYGVDYSLTWHIKTLFPFNTFIASFKG